MNKLWINNTFNDRLAMLQHTELSHPGINQTAIEKDWWVTITLKALFQTECADFLLFKGGTSLSKGFNIIERFSEDIDLALHHSFFKIEQTNKSQREKLRKQSRSYIHNTLSKQLHEQLQQLGVSGYNIENVTTQNKNGESHPINSDKDPTVILLHYNSIIGDNISYIPPRVKIEISCLSMDEPSEERNIHSFIEETYENEDTGANCNIRTVLPTRTFLEKIFLLAEEFQKSEPRSHRLSRHLYDIEKLMDTDYGKEALANRDLYEAIVAHRKTYYGLNYINYDLHTPSKISFIIPDRIRDEWKQDYKAMQLYFIYGKSLDFEELMQRIQVLQNTINKMK